MERLPNCHRTALAFLLLPINSIPTDRKCEDYRHISLMSHVLKIFRKIIQQQIKRKCEQVLWKEQLGFANGLGIREAIFCVQILLQHAQEVYLGLR